MIVRTLSVIIMSAILWRPLAAWEGFWDFTGSGDTVAAARTGGVNARLLPQTQTAAGLHGGALVFPGKHSGAALVKLPVDFTKPFTVIVVAKLAPEAAQGKLFQAFKDLIGNCGTRGPGFRLSVHYGSLMFNSGDGRKAVSVRTSSATAPIFVGEWTQFAAVYDGRTVQLYQNGSAVAAGALQITAGSSTVMVGSNRGTAYFWPGAIDEVRIFDRALKSDEIAKHYLEYLEP